MDLYAEDQRLAEEAVDAAVAWAFARIADDDVTPLELLVWAVAAVLTLALSAANLPA
jgi:hypothetical protein